MKTVFQKIIEGELPAEKILETEQLLVIKDIAPVSSHHFLIIPKKFYVTLDDLPDEELAISVEIFRVAKKLAKIFSLEGHYRLILNVGAQGGQSVFHLHVHFIGGDLLEGQSILQTH
ncbi:HIT domain-containing protein [Candidatus Similichlamydia laticola]|uniref:HIT family hydrolase n=1 Tax=Candidatus Similichlamydia laticola TaxID=2170265 RepID=A0A369KBX6_9BACT|nr:HIT domain-containing protein [Candidatus Similichlamydia laticola]RDB31418.1 HIT family hydrolase [Candidatus Similichlamydia laticola]